MDALRVRQDRGIQGDQESRGGRECRGGGGVSGAWRAALGCGPGEAAGGAGAGRELLGGAEKALGSGVPWRKKRGENRVFRVSDCGWGCVKKQPAGPPPRSRPPRG